jgi:hypothetical protein
MSEATFQMTRENGSKVTNAEFTMTEASFKASIKELNDTFVKYTRAGLEYQEKCYQVWRYMKDLEEKGIIAIVDGKKCKTLVDLSRTRVIDDSKANVSLNIRLYILVHALREVCDPKDEEILRVFFGWIRIARTEFKHFLVELNDIVDTTVNGDIPQVMDFLRRNSISTRYIFHLIRSLVTISTNDVKVTHSGFFKKQYPSRYMGILMYGLEHIRQDGVTLKQILQGLSVERLREMVRNIHAKDTFNLSKHIVPSEIPTMPRKQLLEIISKLNVYWFNRKISICPEGLEMFIHRLTPEFWKEMALRKKNIYFLEPDRDSEISISTPAEDETEKEPPTPKPPMEEVDTIARKKSTTLSTATITREGFLRKSDRSSGPSRTIEKSKVKETTVITRKRSGRVNTAPPAPPVSPVSPGVDDLPPKKRNRTSPEEFTAPAKRRASDLARKIGEKLVVPATFSQPLSNFGNILLQYGMEENCDDTQKLMLSRKHSGKFNDLLFELIYEILDVGIRH